MEATYSSDRSQRLCRHCSAVAALLFEIRPPYWLLSDMASRYATMVFPLTASQRMASLETAPQPFALMSEAKAHSQMHQFWRGQLYPTCESQRSFVEHQSDWP